MKAFIAVSIILSLAIPCGAYAEYNANIKGVVTHVLTYTDSSRIYFRLDNQPTSHPGCETNYFSVDSSVLPDVRAQLLSRLLTAYATKEITNIGFDDLGNCSHSKIRVHRVG